MSVARATTYWEVFRSQGLTTWALPIAIVVVLLLAPSLLSEFRVGLLAKFLTFAILAISLNLIWGYGGMLSLGHAVFFGLGGYAMGMYMKLEASGTGLPDFMFWSGLTQLPWFWSPFQHAWFALPMTFILPAAVAGGLGYLVFRSRITGVYFALITQALALIVSMLFVGQQAYTGGTNGITNFRTVLGFPVSAPETQMALYYITVGALAAIYLLVQAIVSCRFGRLLVAMRDDENRVRFMGYNPVILKTLVFTLSGGIAGIAGALFVPQVGIISPANMGIFPSIEVAAWVVLGGRGTMLGPVLGAVLVSSAKSGLSESFPAMWQFFLGGLFVAAVLLFPTGLMGALRGDIRRLARRLTFWRAPAVAQIIIGGIVKVWPNRSFPWKP